MRRMTPWRRTSLATAMSTLLTFLVRLSPIYAQSSNSTGWIPASDYTVLSGRSGTILLQPGDNSAYRIGPMLDVSSLELRTQNLEANNATAWYCYSSDCTAATGIPLGDNATTRLVPSAFPSGVWLRASVPTTAQSPLGAILQFSSSSPTSCPDPGQTPLLLFPAPSVSTPPPLPFLPAPAETSGPGYSFCVPTPNNHPDFGLSFSWSWSFADLPATFDDGFYAILPPFPLTLPLGVYDVNLVEALAPITGAPISIRLAFLARNSSVLAEFTKSTTGFYVPAVNDIAQGTLEFYLPSGIGNQSAAVYTARHMPSAPPMPPEPLDQICSPASSPYLVQYGKTAFTKIRIPYTTYVEGLGNGGGADGPTALTGGCAFRFPATTQAGDPIARHTLFLSSVPANAAALAWLSSYPFSSQVLLSPGSTASVPTMPPDGLALLLSGAGSVAQPLVVEYMAELAACAAPNVAPVHLSVTNPQTGSNMTLSVCSAAPNVISNSTGTMLDFSFGWNTSRLPAVFSLVNGLTAEVRNCTFSQAKRLPWGWYRVSLLHHPSVTLHLIIGNTSTSVNSTIFLSQPATNISLQAAIPLSRRNRIMSAAVQLTSLPFPPPPLSSPSPPSSQAPVPASPNPPFSPSPPRPPSASSFSPSHLPPKWSLSSPAPPSSPPPTPQSPSGGPSNPPAASTQWPMPTGPGTRDSHSALSEPAIPPFQPSPGGSTSPEHEVHMPPHAPAYGSFMPLLPPPVFSQPTGQSPHHSPPPSLAQGATNPQSPKRAPLSPSPHPPPWNPGPLELGSLSSSASRACLAGQISAILSAAFVMVFIISLGLAV